MDYYSILQIDRKAKKSDIERSFKRLGLKWHPKLSKEDVTTAMHNFCKIAESYEVLSDPMKRAFYDKFGEEKLKEGFYSDGKLSGGYHFAGNPEEIFDQFFAQTNPYACLEDNDGQENKGSLLGYSFGGQQSCPKPAPKNLEIVCECTLKELYNGCSKEIWYNRQVLNPDGRTTKKIQQKKILEVKSGYCSDQRLLFKGEGNMVAGQQTSDLVLIVKCVDVAGFTRSGNNLIYTKKLALIDALMAKPVRLSTLDGRVLQVTKDSIITPYCVKVVAGEGMPIDNDHNLSSNSINAPQKRGDLHIKFDIQFPYQLSLEQQQKVVNALC